MNNIKSKKIKGGYTVLEIIVALGIFIIASAILGVYITESYKTIRFIDEYNAAVEEAKNGISTMNIELREAKNSENGSYAISTASAQNITYYSDIDVDNQTEKIRYFLDGTNLKKGITQPTGDPIIYDDNNEVVTIISQYVENGSTDIFTYYDENFTELNEPIVLTQIRLIHTYLEVNLTPEKAPVNYALQTKVHLRNLKTNY